MTFGDELREAFEQMMLYREAVGYATATYRSSVPPFIDYCVRNYTDGRVITQQMLDRWLAHYSYTANSRAVFVSLIREYTRYLHFLGRDDFIPDDDYSTKRIAFSPYLFTDEELYRLFFAFDGCTGATCGKRDWCFQKWDGGPYSTSWYNQVWRRLWQKIDPGGRSAARPYDLRHPYVKATTKIFNIKTGNKKSATCLYIMSLLCCLIIINYGNFLH